MCYHQIFFQKKCKRFSRNLQNYFMNTLKSLEEWRDVPLCLWVAFLQITFMLNHYEQSVHKVTLKPFLKAAIVFQDKVTGIHLSRGFVEFQDAHSMDAALKHHEHEILNKVVRYRLNVVENSHQLSQNSVSTGVVSEFTVPRISGALPYLGIHQNLWYPVRICSTPKLQSTRIVTCIGYDRVD